MQQLISSASLAIDQPLLGLLTVSGPSWSNAVMAGHPSASAKDDAALRLIFARSATKPRPYPTCTATSRPVHLGVITLSLNSTGNLKTPTTHTLPPTNAASLYSVSSAGLSLAVRTILIETTLSFKSAGPKFYIPNEWSTLLQEGFFRRKRKRPLCSGELWTKQPSLERWVYSRACTWRQQPRQIQRPHSTRSTTTSKRAYAHSRSYYAGSRPARPRCSIGGTTPTITNL
jgi:hypothetical protein